MGRQHTIYMSDKTWSELESLRKNGQSMSEVMRVAIAICAKHQEEFDLLDYNIKMLEAYKRRVANYEKNMCRACKNKLVVL